MIEISDKTVYKAATVISEHFASHAYASDRWFRCDTCRHAYDTAHYAIQAVLPDIIEEIKND